MRAPDHAKELSAVRPEAKVRGAVASELSRVISSQATPEGAQEKFRDFPRRLELALYESHRHHRSAYVRAARRLAWNLMTNGRRLLEEYDSPATLAAVGDRELAVGTPAEQSILRSEERERKLREIIAGRGGLEQSNRSLLRCHRTPACRGAKVEWTDFQSRAADEAAPITATCTACGIRWRLN